MAQATELQTFLLADQENRLKIGKRFYEIDEQRMTEIQEDLRNSFIC